MYATANTAVSVHRYIYAYKRVCTDYYNHTGYWREPAVIFTTADPYGTPASPHTEAALLPAKERNFALLRVTGAYGSLTQSGEYLHTHTRAYAVSDKHELLLFVIPSPYLSTSVYRCACFRRKTLVACILQHSRCVH